MIQQADFETRLLESGASVARVKAILSPPMRHTPRYEDVDLRRVLFVGTSLSKRIKAAESSAQFESGSLEMLANPSRPSDFIWIDDEVAIEGVERHKCHVEWSAQINGLRPNKNHAARRERC